jgi:hypothetical protein
MERPRNNGRLAADRHAEAVGDGVGRISRKQQDIARIGFRCPRGEGGGDRGLADAPLADDERQA